MSNYDEIKAKLARARVELQAIADEQVDTTKGMGQDIALGELNAMRSAAQDLWDEEPQLSRDMAMTLRGLPADDIVRTVFSMGVMVGWRAAKN